MKKKVKSFSATESRIYIQDDFCLDINLLDVINVLPDEVKTTLAIRLGEGGELDYELMLLDKLIDVITGCYPTDCEDGQMANLSEQLLVVKNSLKSII